MDRARLPIVQREPSAQDSARWRHLALGGRDWLAAQPITFTPYASAKPCSARCRFCSETLQDSRSLTPSAKLRPAADYHAALARALRSLRGLPMSYSLSGLEATDDRPWLEATLAALEDHARHASVPERVLYTNGAGLAREPDLAPRLARFGLDWIEWSRHHHEAAPNQAIMRFRPGLAVQEQAVFEQAARRTASLIPLKFVCIVQQGGVADATAARAYLDWARRCGASAVIFRQFSSLDPGYGMNVTRRYIEGARVDVSALMEACLPWLQAERATEGYYFWNLVTRYQDMEVIFEASDYARMHAQHDSGRLYKLVFHANGNLCGGWDPQRNIVLPTGADDA